MLNAVTITTTSSLYDVSMREQVGLVFTCANHTSGNGVFSVDASNDGTNWVTGIAFVDATSTSSTTYVTSKTLSSNTSAGVYLPFYPFRYIRVVCTVTTDGSYTAVMETEG
jgi:hypothetical protein